MINFGYSINKPRVIDIDRNNLHKSNEILHEMPELQTCIGCGSSYEEMNKCMLCGKCRLVCPRGINTRGVVMLIKRKLGDF